MRLLKALQSLQQDLQQISEQKNDGNKSFTVDDELFCSMADRRKAFSLISSRDHSQRSSPSQISYTPRPELEPQHNLSKGLVEWRCAVVITTTPQRHRYFC